MAKTLWEEVERFAWANEMFRFFVQIKWAKTYASGDTWVYWRNGSVSAFYRVSHIGASWGLRVRAPRGPFLLQIRSNSGLVYSFSVASKLLAGFMHGSGSYTYNTNLIPTYLMLWHVMRAKRGRSRIKIKQCWSPPITLLLDARYTLCHRWKCPYFHQ